LKQVLHYTVINFSIIGLKNCYLISYQDHSMKPTTASLIRCFLFSVQNICLQFYSGLGQDNSLVRMWSLWYVRIVQSIKCTKIYVQDSNVCIKVNYRHFFIRICHGCSLLLGTLACNRKFSHEI